MWHRRDSRRLCAVKTCPGRPWEQAGLFSEQAILAIMRMVHAAQSKQV